MVFISEVKVFGSVGVDTCGAKSDDVDACIGNTINTISIRQAIWNANRVLRVLRLHWRCKEEAAGGTRVGALKQTGGRRWRRGGICAKQSQGDWKWNSVSIGCIIRHNKNAIYG